MAPCRSPRRADVDDTLIKALAWAQLWRTMLQARQFDTVNESAVEKQDRGCLGRILVLTLLAPNLAEAILAGRQPEGTTHRCRLHYFWLSRKVNACD